MPTEAHVGAIHSSQIGNVERPHNSNRTKYGVWYRMNGVAWCDIYQSWVFYQAGGGASIVGKFSWTVAHAQWFKKHGRWGTTPRPGALVFFDWSGGHSINGIDHVGFVERVLRDGRLQTIEGNSHLGNGVDGVWRHYRSRYGVVGFGYPAYGTGSTSVAGSRIPNVSLHRKPKKLTVDGVLGPLTVKALQRALKVTADGELGPITKKALQKALGASQTGHIDVNTKRFLRASLGLPVTRTWNQQVTKALQKALNAGKFPKGVKKGGKVVNKKTTTVAALAAALGVGVAALIGVNSGLSPSKPVKPGTTVTVPPKPVPVPKPKPKPAPKPVHHTVAFPGYKAVDFGSHGASVKRLQAQLKAKGASPGALDGAYGVRTRTAVKRFQKAHHLAVDGVVGPKTWKALFG